MAQPGSNKKVANGLVAVSAAAVMAVYAAGYTRTRSAADQFEAQSAERRPGGAEGRGGGQGRGTQEGRGAGMAADAEQVRRANPDGSSESPSRGGSPAAAPDATGPAQVASLDRPPSASGLPANAPSPTPIPTPASTQAAENPTPVTEHKPEAASTPAPAIQVSTPQPVASAPAVSMPVAVASVVPAPAATPPPPAQAASPAPAAAPAPKWKDGTYLGWGTSRHGDIQAQVVIEAGRIKEATIAQCWTRYSCNVIGRLPPQVAQRQSPETDYVSGATQSTNAFYYAVIEALGKAK